MRNPEPGDGPEPEPEPEPEPSQGLSRRPTLWQEIGSVLAAFFGVQNSRNRARDFSHGNATRFIVLGVVFTALFVLAVIVVVRIVLSGAGVG